MHVGVGSGNPVERRAVETVLTGEDALDESATVAGVPVDSGVSEQPSGDAETVAGALGPFATDLSGTGPEPGAGATPPYRR